MESRKNKAKPIARKLMVYLHVDEAKMLERIEADAKVAFGCRIVTSDYIRGLVRADYQRRYPTPAK